MSFSNLSGLAAHAPLRILLIDASDNPSITFAGLAQPLRLAAKILGAQRLTVENVALETAVQASFSHDAHIILLIADDDSVQLSGAPSAAHAQVLFDHCRRAAAWAAVGSAVIWALRYGALEGLRVASPRPPGATGDLVHNAYLTPNLFESDGKCFTCCGGAASIDFALTMIAALYGADLQSDLMQALNVEQVRGANSLHAALSVATADRFGVLQPKLAEALQLMETNIEEPLATDDIANLVGISRRQLERQFKQFLGKVPSRYYLELRLQHAKQLLLESHHSIVQVGLMCGFSSGSHFSTAYGALFGITPREERQRKLSALSSVSPQFPA
jgi:transcriptional regulator GlxA family with amidase domain